MPISCKAGTTVSARGVPLPRSTCSSAVTRVALSPLKSRAPPERQSLIMRDRLCPHSTAGKSKNPFSVRDRYRHANGDRKRNTREGHVSHRRRPPSSRRVEPHHPIISEEQRRAMKANGKVAIHMIGRSEIVPQRDVV